MNFLEQLAAEWYEYQGYFVRRNIKFGRRKKGGYEGEMDIVAYNARQEFIHLETSTDSNSWEERRDKFQKKFRNAEKFYDQLFPFEKEKIYQIAIVSFNRPGIKQDFGDNIRIVYIPELIKNIKEKLIDKHPSNDAIPENLPLLRAIQYAINLK